MAGWELAQLNIGRTVDAVDSPRLAPFMALLDEINALAESSPGFVWRMQSDSGNATDIPVSDDPLVIANLTVWASIEDLYAFTYRSAHNAVFGRRFDWFERWNGPSIVLWWQPAGVVPDLAEAVRRLDLLAVNGPTADAFTFKQRFPPPADAS